MKRILSIAALCVLLSLVAVAEKQSSGSWNALSVVHNARFVYVTSYDGPQFSMNLLPEDRAAIAAVQNAIANDGYTVVYNPRQADMILAVQARGSSDLLAVYDGRGFGEGTYLWRAEAKNGLSGPDPTLVQQFEQAQKNVSE